HQPEPEHPPGPNATFAALLARLTRDERARAASGEDRTPVQSVLQRVPQPRPVDRRRQVLRLAAGEKKQRDTLQRTGVLLELSVLAGLHGQQPRIDPRRRVVLERHPPPPPEHVLSL